MTGTCSFVKPDGERCKAFPIRDSDKCFHHDPSKEKERSKAKRRGGENSRRYVALPDVQAPKNAQEAADLLGLVAQEVLRGVMDLKMASTVAGVLRSYIQVKLGGKHLPDEDKSAQEMAEMLADFDDKHEAQNPHQTISAAHESTREWVEENYSGKRQSPSATIDNEEV